MSLVGTRPPTVDEWEKYELHHRSRMSTKPGITGMQIVFLYLGKYSKILEIWTRRIRIRWEILTMDLKRQKKEFLFGFVISLWGSVVITLLMCDRFYVWI